MFFLVTSSGESGDVNKMNPYNWNRRPKKLIYHNFNKIILDNTEKYGPPSWDETHLVTAKPRIYQLNKNRDLFQNTAIFGSLIFYEHNL